MSLTAGTDNYTMNADGNRYDKVPATGDATNVSAFRPYFTASSSAKTPPGVKRQLPSYIVFNGSNGDEFNEGPESALNGDLIIYAKGRDIITISHLKEPISIRITRVNGVTITNYALQPGQTVTTPVNAAGAYIVNNKKVFVK